MSSASPAKKKRDIFNIILNDDEIIELLDAHNVTDRDEILGKYIFPYLKIDYTVQDVGTYIGVKVDYHNTNPNPVVKDLTVIFLVMSNNKHIMTDFGDTRTDLIGDRINQLFVWSNKTGFPFTLVSDVEDAYNETFYYRKITLTAMEEDNIVNGRKNRH